MSQAIDVLLERLDNEMSTIRRESKQISCPILCHLTDPCLVTALRYQRTLLTAALLSSKHTTNRLQRAQLTGSRKYSQNDITQTLSTCNSARLSTLALARRATAGITAFRVKDPDPHAVNGGRVLGVRFDVFSTSKRAFEKPYYVFLVRAKSEGEEDQNNRPHVGADAPDEEWRVHRHTIPSAIPVAMLVRRYLPLSAAAREEDAGAERDGRSLMNLRQDLGAFVRAVRKQLVGMVRRRDVLQALEKTCVSSSTQTGLATQMEIVDGVGREIELSLRDGAVLRFRIDMGGELVEKAVARMTDGAGGRRQDLERLAMDDGGRLEGLVDRLGEAL
jgi:central kinetochore subunit Mal2/MCM21